jgi:hypothetical protein
MSDYQIEALRSNPKITVIEGDSISKLNRDDNGNPRSMETAKGKVLPIKALGEFIGSMPDTKWVHSDVAVGKGGRIQTNNDLETALPGVYAVGDMRDGAVGRVGVAVGEGQLALRQANVFLDEQRSAAKKAYGKAAGTSDALIGRLFDLDRDNAWLGQTIDDVTPLKKKKPRAKAWDESQHPRDEQGQFTESGDGGGSGGDDELGSLALGGEDRFTTALTRKVDALRDEMGVGDIPVGQRQALDMYTQDSTSFNLSARSGYTTGAETENLDKLVSSYTLPRDMTVYRTVGWQRTQNMLDHVGDSFSDPAFMSTTLDKSKIDKPGSYIEIQVPKGSRAFPVGSLSNFPEEAEILFPRNSRLQIVSHEPRDAPNTQRFVARLVS